MFFFIILVLGTNSLSGIEIKLNAYTWLYVRFRIRNANSDWAFPLYIPSPPSIDIKIVKYTEILILYECFVDLFFILKLIAC